MGTNETKISYEVHHVVGVKLTLGDVTHIVECRHYVGCRPMGYFFDGEPMTKAEAGANAKAFAAQGASQTAGRGWRTQ